MPGKRSRVDSAGRKLSRTGYPKRAPKEQSNSTSALKNRIRDLRRLLGHLDNDPTSKMPADVRVERERELEACEHDLGEKQAADKEEEFKRKIIGKYHGIRFFERQKATRIVKRLTKQLPNAKNESEKASLLRKIHNADVDVNYTLYYPLLKPYVSLFPRKEGGSGDGPVDGPKGNLDMWRAVEKAMEDGKLEALRNSKDGVTVLRGKDSARQGNRRQEREDRKKGKSKDAASSARKEDENDHEGEDDSDGGFFE